MCPENLKILIACKKGDTLELLAKAVCSKYPNLRLFFATTTEECFHKQEQHRPDVLILVIDERVFELVSTVSSVLSIHPQCTVLVLSHYGSGESISKCVLLGVKDVLTLPLNYELFLCKLGALLTLHSGVRVR